MLKERVAFVVAIVAFSVGAFFAGRASAPEPETKVEFKSLLVEDLTRGLDTKKARSRIVQRNVVTTTTDAGTVTVDKTTEHETDSELTTLTETSNKSVDTSNKISIASTQANWRVGVQAGASLREPSLVIAGPLVIGASVEARIAKTPMSVGLWANTVGAGGVSLSVEF